MTMKFVTDQLPPKKIQNTPLLSRFIQYMRTFATVISTVRDVLAEFVFAPACFVHHGQRRENASGPFDKNKNPSLLQMPRTYSADRSGGI